MFSGNSEKLFLFHERCIFKLDIKGWNFHQVDWIEKKTGSEVEINMETFCSGLLKCRCHEKR